MSTLTLPNAAEPNSIDSPRLFPGIIGFYFVFRDCLTFLLFQSNPVAGTVVNISVDLALLLGTILYSIDPGTDRNYLFPRTTPIRWLFALLALSFTSLIWSEAQSVLAAFAYWLGMASDVIIVLLVVRGEDARCRLEVIMKGAVLGATTLAAVAWCSPLTADLRFGNDTFLHPNILGLDLGLTTLVAQYLIPWGSRWKWLGIVLAITLLRTLSKTAIIAFVIAECWYLIQNRQLTRRSKLGLTVAAVMVVGSFWSVLGSYLDAYNNTGSGNQAETLTGRTVLWATAYSMSLEKPWFGHGIYSFKWLIPAFGPFEPVHAHNELLQQFFEYGGAGVVVTVGVYWSFFRLALRAPSSQLRSLALTLVLFAALRGLADTVNFGLSFPLWLLTALSTALVQPASIRNSSQ